jgi:DNA-binding NtrC family response regulator
MSDPSFLPHSSAVLNGPCREAKKKVLIVDDEYLIRYSLKKLIEREGYAAFTAGTGHEALRLFEEQRPDIVILDIRLPDSNGLSLLKTIKESCPSVAMIMATGCPDVQSNVEAMKMGALAYLEKPVDMDSLKTLMRGTAPAAQIQ